MDIYANPYCRRVLLRNFNCVDEIEGAKGLDMRMKVKFVKKLEFSAKR